MNTIQFQRKAGVEFRRENKKMENSRQFNKESLQGQSRVTEKVKYRGELRIIGKVVPDRKDENILGYIIMTEKTNKFKIYTVEQTKALLKKFTFVNAVLVGNVIENTECSMNRLPKFDVRMNPLTDKDITILGKIYVNDKVAGYRVMNQSGAILDLPENKVIEYAMSGAGLINAKLVYTNDKCIISAIKGEFTRIEKNTNNTGKSKSVNNGAAAWRKLKHREKLENKVMVKSILIAMGQSKAGYATLHNLRRSDGDIHIQEEIKIIVKEILPKYISKGHEDEALAKTIVNKYKVPEIITYNTDPKDIRNVNLVIVGLSQFILNDPKILEEIKNKIKPSKTGTTLEFSTLQKDGLITKNMLMLDIFRNDLIKKHSVQVESMKKKSFNTTKFVTSREIAQLGFAINENNKGYQFKTDTGNNYKLIYLGDCLPNYSEYKEHASVFGDLAIPAQIQKTIRVDYFTPRDKEIRVEIMLAMLAIYNPQIAKLVIRDNIEQYPCIGKMLPGCTFEDTDYKINKQVKLYYDSGLTVFLNDHGHNGGGRFSRQNYTKKYKKSAEYINYRAAGNAYTIKHDMLYSELVPVIGMLTSEQCDVEEIEWVLGSLRVI